MSYLKPDINEKVYPTTTATSVMRNWMNQVNEIGEISHPDRNKELIDEFMNLKIWEFQPIFNDKNAKLDFELPVGKLFYVDFVYDDGQVHLKTNRKRIILQFNWMEEVNYGTRFYR